MGLYKTWNTQLFHHCMRLSLDMKKVTQYSRHQLSSFPNVNEAARLEMLIIAMALMRIFFLKFGCFKKKCDELNWLMNKCQYKNVLWERFNWEHGNMMDPLKTLLGGSKKVMEMSLIKYILPNYLYYFSFK